MLLSHIMPSLLSGALLLTIAIRTAAAVEVPPFDPDRDSIDTILATLPWLPPGTLKPPTIDRSAFKPADVPIDPAWTRVEDVWRPGVPKMTGHTMTVLVKESGGLIRPVTNRVGRCTDYDQHSRVVADGTWDAEGKPIGCHLTFADLSVAAKLRLKPTDPLPLLAVTLYAATGAPAAQTTSTDLGDTASPAFWDPANRPISDGKITFFPTGELEAISWILPVTDPSPIRIPGVTTVRFHPPNPGRVAANDPSALMGIRSPTPAPSPQVAKFFIRSPGEDQLERTVQYSPSGQLAQITCTVIGFTRSSDPRKWELKWTAMGIFNHLAVGDARYVADADGELSENYRRIVRWKNLAKMEDGILAMGFVQKDPAGSWVPTGPWSTWNENKKPVATGKLLLGKPVGSWTERRWEPQGDQRLIEEATGTYQDGVRHGLWRVKCLAGHPDLSAKRPDGMIRFVTYQQGQVTDERITGP